MFTCSLTWTHIQELLCFTSAKNLLAFFKGLYSTHHHQEVTWLNEAQPLQLLFCIREALPFVQIKEPEQALVCP